MFRENGLTIVLLAIFALLMVGMSISGWLDHNIDLAESGQLQLGYWRYLLSSHFVEGVFENWESEFLQMGAYVYITVFLRQRGSAESNAFDDEEDLDSLKWEKIAQQTTHPDYPRIPAVVRRGGWKLKVYENSLTLSFLAMFLFSMFGHAAGGVAEYNREQALHGEAPISLGRYLVSSHFWWESFQNWQSEFLAVASIVVLTIWLRQKGSSESKEVAAPHRKTGK
jgi:hypothetical protein